MLVSDQDVILALDVHHGPVVDPAAVVVVVILPIHHHNLGPAGGQVGGPPQGLHSSGLTRTIVTIIAIDTINIHSAVCLRS